MSVQLLDKTRKINKLLHNNNTHKVVFNDICRVLSDILESDILVISRKGKVLGIENRSDITELTEMIVAKVGDFIDPVLNERLLGVLSTKENVNLATLGFELDNLEQYQAIISPIDIAGERLGTLFLYKVDKPYTIDDIILSEYATTVVGLEMLRSENEESAEEDRKLSDVHSAISTLSASEQEAIYYVFDELYKSGGFSEDDGFDNGFYLVQGMLVTSKIADRVGITRSVIVNALKKFESAGVIETKSAGMKGTNIKVLNEYVFKEVFKLHR